MHGSVAIGYKGGARMVKILYAVMDEERGEGFEDEQILAPGEYEMILFETEVRIEVGGILREYPSHTCILYQPGQTVHYRSVRERLVYSWIRFNCDEELYRGGFLPFGVPANCPDYEWYKLYWQASAKEFEGSYASSSYVATRLMHIMFHRFHDYVFDEEESGYQKSFLSLREQIYQYPERQWTLEEMSQQVKLGTRSLQKFYKKFFGISCMNEVILSRINRAKLLLVRTTKGISEISQQCGYNNWEHFSRQFKSREGLTPTQYRREHAGGAKR